MKKILTLITIAGMALCLFGCQKDKVQTENPKQDEITETITIAGEWKLTNAEYAEQTLLSYYEVESYDELTDEQKEEYDLSLEMSKEILKSMLETTELSIKFGEDETCELGEGYDEEIYITDCTYVLDDKTITITPKTEAPEPVEMTYDGGEIHWTTDEIVLIFTRAEAE